MPLVTKPVGCAATLLEHTFLSPAQRAQDEQSRRTQAHRSEALRIGPQCVGQHQGLTPVILGPATVWRSRSDQAVWDGSHTPRTPARVTSLPWRHGAPQWPRRPGWARRLTPRATRMPTVPDWFHHAGPHAHRHGGVAGRGSPPGGSGRPNQSPQTLGARCSPPATNRYGGWTRRCDHPALLLSLGAPMVSAQPWTGAHGATSSKR